MKGLGRLIGCLMNEITPLRHDKLFYVSDVHTV